MAHQEQISTVKRALELEQEISQQREEISSLQAKQYPEPPASPAKRQLSAFEPPPIETKTKLHWNWLVVILISLFGFFPIGLIGVIAYRKITKHMIAKETEQIRSSDDYQKQCAALKENYDKQCQEAEEEFKEAQHKYETEVLSKYEAERDSWEQQKSAEIEQRTNQLRRAEGELSDLYENTKIVPVQYRNIPALQYIHDMISTSDYGIREAIDNYDKSEQRKLEEERIRKQDEANQLAYEQNQLAYEQNALLEEQNTIAEKARRDANIAAIAGAVQRHNINRTLKGR